MYKASGESEGISVKVDGGRYVGDIDDGVTDFLGIHYSAGCGANQIALRKCTGDSGLILLVVLKLSSSFDFTSGKFSVALGS